MPYAHRPLILDADTHMMEHADWLPAVTDPIGRYERTLGGVGEPLKANAYHRNFAALFADRRCW